MQMLRNNKLSNDSLLLTQYTTMYCTNMYLLFTPDFIRNYMGAADL